MLEPREELTCAITAFKRRGAPSKGICAPRHLKAIQADGSRQETQISQNYNHEELDSSPSLLVTAQRAKDLILTLQYPRQRIWSSMPRLLTD
jgi:hypothetical protein